MVAGQTPLERWKWIKWWLFTNSVGALSSYPVKQMTSFYHDYIINSVLRAFWLFSAMIYLRAATCKCHLQLCKIEKSKILKLCHNKVFRYLITEILVSVHSREYFSFAATFPSRMLQGQANRLKILINKSNDFFTCCTPSMVRACVLYM